MAHDIYSVDFNVCTLNVHEYVYIQSHNKYILSCSNVFVQMKWYMAGSERTSLDTFVSVCPLN